MQGRCRGMAKQSNQKGKLLYVRQILLRKTDAQHGVTIADITQGLAQHGIAAERKSLYDDIETLRACGMEIETVRGRANSYRAVNRVITAQEVLQIAAVSKELAQCLCGLLSVYEAEAVQQKLDAVIGVIPAPAAQPQPSAQAEEEAAELKCAKEIAPEVLAYLGSGAQIAKEKGSSVYIAAQVVFTPAFYAQLVKWGGQVKLNAPAARRKEFVKFCKKIISQYK